MRERAQRARKVGRLSGLLLVGILLTGLAASTGLPHRMDLTEGGEFTLSSATLELLGRLEDAPEDLDDVIEREPAHTEVLEFDHVRPTSGGGAWQLLKEAAKLYRHMYSVIRDAN